MNAVFVLNGYQITILINNFVFTGNVDCRQFGAQARLRFDITSPAYLNGEGSVTQGADGRSYFQVRQSNGLVFGAVR